MGCCPKVALLPPHCEPFAPNLNTRKFVLGSRLSKNLGITLQDLSQNLPRPFRKFSRLQYNCTPTWPLPLAYWNATWGNLNDDNEILYTPTTTSAKHLLVMVAAWCAYIACGWTTQLGHPTHANSLMILTSVLLTSLDTLPMRQIVHMLAHGQQAGDQALGLGPHKRHKQAWICSHGASNELQSTSFPNEWSRCCLGI